MGCAKVSWSNSRVCAQVQFRIISGRLRVHSLTIDSLRADRLGTQPRPCAGPQWRFFLVEFSVSTRWIRSTLGSLFSLVRARGTSKNRNFKMVDAINKTGELVVGRADEQSQNQAISNGSLKLKINLRDRQSIRKRHRSSSPSSTAGSSDSSPSTRSSSRHSLTSSSATIVAQPVLHMFTKFLLGHIILLLQSKK